MAAPKAIRADEARLYLDDVSLPGHRGIYRAASHDRADKAGYTLFVSTRNHHAYIEDGATVWLRNTPEMNNPKSAMRSLRILQHERRTDEIRIGRAFCQNHRSFDDVAEEVKAGYTKRGAADLNEYYSLITIVDAFTLKTIYVIHSDSTHSFPKESRHGSIS